MTKILFLFSICILGILPAQADVSNLINNGDFTEVKDGHAASWNFSSAKPEIFKLSFPQQSEQGTVAKMEVSSDVMSGYWGQIITVKPHTNYRFSALAQMNTGHILMYIHGGSGETKIDTRIYVLTMGEHPLVPWFWDKQWIQGSSGFPHRGLGLVRNFLAEPGQWEPVSIEFNSGELTRITVSLGAYFKTGQYLFDDVSVMEIPAQK